MKRIAKICFYILWVVAFISLVILSLNRSINSTKQPDSVHVYQVHQRGGDVYLTSESNQVDGMLFKIFISAFGLGFLTMIGYSIVSRFSSSGKM